MQLKKSGIPLTIEIRNPSSTDKESEIQYLESGIHGVESRIQSCLGFPYVMWHTNHNELYWQQRANNKIDHGKFTVPNTCTRILQVKTRHLRYTNELLCRQQRTNSLFIGISDESEVATVAIDETTILEIKATTVLPFWSRLIWQHKSCDSEKEIYQTGCCTFRVEMAVIVVYPTNPMGLKPFSYEKTFFCSSKFVWRKMLSI